MKKIENLTIGRDLGLDPGRGSGLKFRYAPLGKGSLASRSASTRGRFQQGPLAKEANQVSQILTRQSEVLSRLHSMTSWHGGQPKPGGFTFDMLRMAVRHCPLLTAVHSARKHQVRYMATALDSSDEGKNKTGFTIVHKRYNDADFEITDDINRRCAAITNLFNEPHPHNEKSFSSFLTKLVDDHLTLDRACVEIIRDRDGLPVSLVQVDGATVLPIAVFLRLFVRSKYGQDYQSLSADRVLGDVWNNYQQDVTNAEFVQIVDGQLVNTFAPGDLIVGISNPMPDVYSCGFGRSLVEEAIVAATDWQNAYKYNSNYFKNGVLSDFLLHIKEEGKINDEFIEDFKDALMSDHSGVENAHTVPVVGTNGEITAIHLKRGGAEMELFKNLQFDTFLTLAIYRMDPKEVNIPETFQGSSPLSEGNKDLEIRLSQEQGLHSIFQFFASAVFGPIVREFDPDFIFHWIGMEMEDGEDKQIANRQNQSGWATINEQRQEEGRDPIRGKFIEWADVPKEQAARLFELEMQKNAEAMGVGGGGSPEGEDPGGGGDPGGDPPGSLVNAANQVPDEVVKQLHGGEQDQVPVEVLDKLKGEAIAKSLDVPEMWV